MAGIYIHVPFCHAKCAYCDFYSKPLDRGMADSYVRAVISEYEARHDELAGDSVETVYLGGGTPSILEDNLLSELIDAVCTDCVSELTMEVNPEDVTPRRAEKWLQAGVNRISMGVQSLNDRELAAVGRRHTAARALDAIDSLRRAGVTNLSLDVIYGLPGQSIVSFGQTLDRLFDSSPEHLSAYMLSYEPGTRLAAMLQAGKITEASEDYLLACYDILCDKAAQAGMIHYEISNFSKPGYESRHNSSYWNLTPYLGLGPGAHSYTLGRRRYQPSDLRHYLSGPVASLVTEQEQDMSEMINETLMLALRTACGLDMAQYGRRFGSDELKRLNDAAQSWLDSGQLLVDGHRLYVPERAMPVTDAILTELFV